MQQLKIILNVPSQAGLNPFLLNFRGNMKKPSASHPEWLPHIPTMVLNILINAIRKAGAPDREKIQEALKEIEYLWGNRNYPVR